MRAKDKNFNAGFTTDFDERIDKISIVPQSVGRVLPNIFNNAFYAVSNKKKSSPDSYHPAVHITTKKVSSKAEITIEDNGEGIPEAIISKIFEPFFTTKLTGRERSWFKPCI